MIFNNSKIPLSANFVSKITAFIMALVLTLSVFKTVDFIKNGKDDVKEEITDTGAKDEKDENSTEENPNQNIFIYNDTITITSAFSSDSMIMCDLNNKNVVVEKQSQNKISGGDTVNLVVAAYICHKADIGKINLEEYVVCPASAVRRANYGRSAEVFSVGMKMRISDLVKCMVYQRGSSYAYSVAVHLSENEDNFVNEINEFVNGIGMKSTVYGNICGEDDGNSYTTAYDFAVLIKYITENVRLSEIFGSKEPIKIKKYNESSSVYLSVGNDFYENTCTESQAKADGITGGKTGYCNLSGWCAVTFYNGTREYIIIALGSHQSYADVLRMYAAYSKN